MCRLLDRSQAFVAKVQLHIPPKSPSTKIQGHFAVAGLRESAVRIKFSRAVMDEVSGEWRAEAGGGERNGRY